MAPLTLAPHAPRQRTEVLVQTWLKERQHLLAQLCALPDTHTGDDESPALRAHIQTLCQTLMDYISAGYFEVYRELASEARRDGQHPAWIESVLRQLDASTDAALAFNDHYDQTIRQQRPLAEMPRQIAALLEQLEQRFSLEDQLILSVHLQGHQPPQPDEPPLRAMTH